MAYKPFQDRKMDIYSTTLFISHFLECIVFCCLIANVLKFIISYIEPGPCYSILVKNRMICLVSKLKKKSYFIERFLISEMGMICVCGKSLQSYLTLCNPVDHSLPSSSVHGILQARVLEWVAVSFFRGFS